MGRRLSKADHERIHAEIAWLNRPVDPNRCWCHHWKCVEESGHATGECLNPPTSKVWTHQWEHFCDRCREYHDGVKQPEYMTAR